MLAFTLIDADNKKADYMIHPSDEAELPTDNKYIQRLVKQGYLQEVEVAKVNPVTNPQKDK